MKRVRKDLEQDMKNDVSFENGLIIRQVPHIKKMQFEPNTGDFMVYKRKTELNLEEEFLQSYKATLRFKQVLEAKRMKLDHESPSSKGSTHRAKEEDDNKLHEQNPTIEESKV